MELDVPLDYFNVEGAITKSISKDKFETITGDLKEEKIKKEKGSDKKED